MRAAKVTSVVNEAGASSGIIGVRLSIADDEEGDDPWTLPPSRRKREKPLEGPLPEKTRLVLSDLIYLEKDGMPAGMRNRLLRMAAFQNPEFYRAKAMRLSTFGKSRNIACAEDYPRHIDLPRGCFDDVMHFRFEYIVIPRATGFRIPTGIEEPGIQDVYAALVADEQRNDIIFNDLLNSLEDGRYPLLLTERTEHLEYFAGRLKGFARNVIIFRGGMGSKQRRELAKRIYDYVDEHVPTLMRMYGRKLKGYKAIGYAVQAGMTKREYDWY